MKFNRYIFRLALVSFLASPFISCSDGDKDDDTPSGAPNDYEIPTYEPKDGIDPDQHVSISGEIGNHTYVDLGLPSGTKWATYNVGTDMSYMQGSFFAWGETENKEKYSITNYKWSVGDINPKMTKYCTSNEFGTVDNKTTLDPEDDAAAVNWGNGWRMPTRDEFEELKNGCDWKIVTNFNFTFRAGMVGTSKTNHNVIFFPAAGHNYDSSNEQVNLTGFYWTSSIKQGGSSAYSKEFTGTSETTIYKTPLRHFGQSVRAVAAE